MIVQWLLDTYGCEVICYAADVGQKERIGRFEGEAIKTGASKIYIDDLREEFARDFIFPALRANAIYEGVYLLGTSLQAADRQTAVEIAALEGPMVCWRDGKGSDQVQFELTYMALNPHIRIISAWKDNWIFDSGNPCSTMRKSTIFPSHVKEKPYSEDRNSLHISHEGGILEDPWAEPPRTFSS